MNLQHINIKPDEVYSFNSFEIEHDRIKVKFGPGHFVTIFAGDIPVGGIIIGKGGFYYDPPRQLAIDNTDSDVEEYQLMRFTGTKEEDIYSSGKKKLEDEPFEDGFSALTALECDRAANWWIHSGGVLFKDDNGLFGSCLRAQGEIDGRGLRHADPVEIDRLSNDVLARPDYNLVPVIR